MRRSDAFIQMLESTMKESQESWRTSTPRPSSPAGMSSLSVSTIQGSPQSGASAEVFSNSEVEETGYDFSSSTPPVGKKLKWPPYLRSLMSKNRDSLYYKLTNQPRDADSIAVDAIYIYRSNPNKGIILILQLFVDLCGYKNVSLEKLYNFEQQNAQEIVNRMQSDLMDTELKKTGKFLFQKSSNFECQIVYIIAEFLNNLVSSGCKTEVLFEELFPSHIFEFLNCMAFSEYRFIRITGVILVIKFLTAFINLYKKLFSDNYGECNSSISEESADKKTKIENVIDFLYKIYTKNCLYPNSKCYVMKVKCVREMVVWMKLFPKIFIFKRKCLAHLVKLIVDQSESVRLVALDSCAKLLTSEEIRQHMALRVEVCLKISSGRLNDANNKVVAKAIHVFTAAIHLYFTYITEDYILSITNKIYFQNVLVAKAGGKFLAAYLAHQHNDKEILLSLCKTAHLKKQYSERVPFFLESCIEYVPQLQNWKLIIKTLLDDEIDFESRKHLMTFFREGLMFALTGKFTQNRVPNFEVRRGTTDPPKIVKEITTNIEHLISRFQGDKEAITHLTEVLGLLNTQLDQQHLVIVLRMLKNMFIAKNNEGLIRALSRVLSNFCEQKNELALAVVKNIIQGNVNNFKSDLLHLNPGKKDAFSTRLSKTTLKISILFEFFDLTEYLQWEDIFDIWNENSFKVLKYALTCCKWFLVWNLRQYIKISMRDNGENLNHLLYGNCKDFVYTCLDLLKEANGNDESFFIFETICDFYASFERELVKKRIFSKFFIKIIESNYRELLVTFVVIHVIENKNIELIRRRTLLSKFVDLVYLDVIPAEHFSRILRYYHSHDAEFGEIMLHILNSLYSCNPGLPLVVQHTLAQMYTQILERNGIVNLSSDEAKHLKLLAKRLASFKPLKSPNILLKLVHMIIYFGLRSEEYYPFLYFGRYFAQLLTKDAKQDAYSVFQKRVPRQHKKNDTLLLFASVLKSMNSF